MAIDGELVRHLAEQGNRELAARIVREADAAASERRSAHDAVAGAHPPPTGIFAVLAGEGREPLTCALRVETGCEHSAALGDAATEQQAELAMQEAWRLVGATGTRPALGVRLDLAERLGMKVCGPSLFLPSLLAAVATLCHRRPLGNAMATGAPGEPVSNLPNKLELFRSCREFLGLERLLVASASGLSPQLGESDAGLVELVADADAAVRRAFGYLPWHASCPVRRVHVYAGAHRRKAPWPDDAHPVKVELPDRLAPADLDGAVAQVREAIAEASRVEISVGANEPLAGLLGYELKNGPSVVRVVHADGRPWWDNRMRPRAADCPDARPDARLPVRLSTAPSREGEWRHIQLPAAMEPEDLPAAVDALLAAAAEAATVDLAVRGPLPVAWAAAQVLRNIRAVRFFHWEQTAYRLWWEKHA